MWCTQSMPPDPLILKLTPLQFAPDNVKNRNAEPISVKYLIIFYTPGNIKEELPVWLKLTLYPGFKNWQ